jgi:selenocysteine-specific elongation factor
VLTGTVLGGEINVGDMVELPALGQQKKIKSLQMFHRPGQRCQQGDRVGICVTGLDAKLVERGLAATPGSVPSVSTALVMVRKTRFYRGGIESTAKCHVTVGHATVMAKCTFFGGEEVEAAVARARLVCSGEGDADTTDSKDGAPGSTGKGARGKGGGLSEQQQEQQRADMLLKAVSMLCLEPGFATNFPPLEFDSAADYNFQENMVNVSRRPVSVRNKVASSPSADAATDATSEADGNTTTEHGEESEQQTHENTCVQWCVMEFDSPVLCQLNTLVIASRLDESAKDACR